MLMPGDELDPLLVVRPRRAGNPYAMRAKITMIASTIPIIKPAPEPESLVLTWLLGGLFMTVAI